MIATEQNEQKLPRWHQELDVFSSVKSALILEGNVLDNYEFPYGCAKTIWMDLPNYLYYYFTEKGYKNIIRYNCIDGFTTLGLNLQEDERKAQLSSFAELLQDGEKQINGDHIPASFISQPGRRGTTAPFMIRDVLSQHNEPTVIILELASRYITTPERLDPSALESYTTVLQGILRENNMSSCDQKRNLVVFIANKKNDIPAWMYLDNSQIKSIMIDYPNAAERLKFIGGYEPSDFIHRDHYEKDMESFVGRENELHKLIDKFVARTDGFTYLELKQLRDLSQERMIHLKDLCSVIDLYIYGMIENPWRDEALLQRLIRGKEIITSRVKGQDHVVIECLDVLKRAVTGLSQLRNEASPKGILFFAGPTGTGKTETAKALASLVFGDESACIRFDMSEYQHEHSDQRLMGAPPGYVGYEAGGQLTNAVRRNPFSILLFDEIEKASPKIMDKFLQILEDGRMTDGQGNTAYFSDSIIIFTSNLGIYGEDRDQLGERKLLVKPDQPKEEVRSIVRAAIERHFNKELGRPEILNRIGENIFVFDFISPEVAELILNARLEKIQSTIKSKNGIELDFSLVKEQLFERVKANLRNGGRGINNIVEKELINPLARHIFDERVQEGEKRIITKILDNSTPVDIEWRKDE